LEEGLDLVSHFTLRATGAGDDGHETFVTRAVAALPLSWCQQAMQQQVQFVVSIAGNLKVQQES